MSGGPDYDPKWRQTKPYTGTHGETQASPQPVTFESLKERWRNSLNKCVGYPNCDGDLEGEPHEKNCPEYGREHETIYLHQAIGQLESLEQRVRELRDDWRRDANAYRLRAPNAGSEYVMGRARQLEEDAAELTALLGDKGLSTEKLYKSSQEKK